MGEISEIIRRYRQVTDLPLFARPNAGTPVRGDNGWVHPQTPSAMAAGLPQLLEAGVSMIGGLFCATPSHIAAFPPPVDEWQDPRCREGNLLRGSCFAFCLGRRQAR